MEDLARQINALPDLGGVVAGGRTHVARRRQGASPHYLFLAPGPPAVRARFRVYPLLDGLWLSFTNARLGRTAYACVGLANYARLLDDTRFHASLWNTAFYTAASTLPILAMPLLLAVAAEPGRAQGRRCGAPSSFRSRSRWSRSG